MKFMPLCAILAGAVLVLCAQATRAGPLEPSFAPSQPVWIVHLDLEAARNSHFGSTILNSLGEKRRGAIELLATEFGLTSPQSVLSLTVFSEQDPESGCAVIMLGRDGEHIASNLQNRNLSGFETSEDFATTFMSWISKGDRILAAVVRLHDDRRALLFAKSENGRAQAITRLLAKPHETQGAEPTMERGTIFLARVVDMNSPSFQSPKARMLKLAKSLDARFMETTSPTGETSCISSIQLTAADTQDAEAMRSLCTGLMQATRLSMSKNPELVGFESSVFDPVQMSVSDSTLTVQARHAPEDLALLIDALRALSQPKSTSAQNPVK